MWMGTGAEGWGQVGGQEDQSRVGAIEEGVVRFGRRCRHPGRWGVEENSWQLALIGAGSIIDRVVVLGEGPLARTAAIASYEQQLAL